jgi:GrpB-like predicted nucleotidyltransferase (UPF0157 family)/GNAT superfamily N-acetyltransferase
MVKNNIVEVVPYNPQWPDMFASEAAKIKQALGDNCIHVLHIGSTSIPGLAAKPIIDMIPVVKDILAVDELPLMQLGYRYRGEMGMMFRRFCQKYEPHISVHAHIWEEGNPEIEKHLLFRQHLINHPKDLKAYEDLKYLLASEFKEDRRTYTLSKDDLVKSILVKTGFEGKLIVEALTETEWEAYHRIRKEQIFDRLGVLYDPQHPTITAENHYHFVMSLGTTIVGVAHVEFLDEHRAALRPFAMDTPYQNSGYGSWFLTQIERWLTHRHKSLVQLHSDPLAVPFYKRLGYRELPFTEPGYAHEGTSLDMGKKLEPRVSS